MRADVEDSNSVEGENLSSHVRFNRKSKIQGKWCRDNENIGGFPIQKANELATKLTGVEIDLKLPRFSDLCTYWSKCYWMMEADVVTHKTVCLLCRTPVFEPMFFTHMKTLHPTEDKQTITLMSHLQQVRLSLFYATSSIFRGDLRTLLPSFEALVLDQFLEEIGFIVETQKSDEEMKHPVMKRNSGKKPRSQPTFNAELNVLDKTDLIFGVPAEEAEMMAEVMNEGYAVHKGLFFTRSSARHGMKCDYCFPCQVIVRRLLATNHRKTAYHKCHQVEDELFGVAVSKRLTDQRVLKFSCANPIPLWKLKEVSPEGDEAAVTALEEFLTQRGYIIDKLNVERGQRAWPYVVENIGELVFNVEDDDNKSSASNSSSISSTSSTQTAHAKPPVNYFVMDGIRKHEKVLESILQLEEIFDKTGTLTQTQFAFVFGWTAYSLVVSNGCKLSPLCNMKDHDFDSLQMINDTEPLALIKFETPKTGEGGFMASWLILDRLTYDAFVFYRKVRDKVIHDRGGRANSFFFVSYSNKNLVSRDVDYPMNQFLRMCGAQWCFRAKHLTNAVNELIVRVAEKNSPDYALHFFKQLKLRSQKQKEVMESGEPNHFLVNMQVIVQKKVRKDKIVDSDENEGSTKAKRSRLCISPETRPQIECRGLSDDSDSSETEEPCQEMDRHTTPERGLYAYAMTPPYLTAGNDKPENEEQENIQFQDLSEAQTSEENDFNKERLYGTKLPTSYADEPHHFLTQQEAEDASAMYHSEVPNPYKDVIDKPENFTSLESFSSCASPAVNPDEVEFVDL